jgi:hypothetical protein
MPVPQQLTHITIFREPTLLCNQVLYQDFTCPVTALTRTRPDSVILVYIMGWFLDEFVEYFFRIFFRAMNLLRSRRWPIVKATVLSADCEHATLGCTVARVYYEYVVSGEKYGSTLRTPFISPQSGADYVAQFVKGLDFKVRVKPTDASTSVPLWGLPSR